MGGDWQPEFTTCPDGAKLSFRRLRALRALRGSAVVLHGWGDHAGRFAEVARQLAAQGLDVWALDQRGHGQSPGPRGHVDRFAQFLSDVAQVRKLAAAESPGPQFLVGHSFGGFVVLRYLETMPAGVAGAIAVTPFVDFARPPARWKVTLARVIVDIAPTLPISTGLDYDHIAHDREQVEAFRADPLAHQRMTPRAYLETIRALAALRQEKDRITAPLLVLLAGDDRIVSTPAARDFARSLRGDVTVHEYPGMYHNVFYEPERPRVFGDIANWIERRLSMD